MMLRTVFGLPLLRAIINGFICQVSLCRLA